MKSVTKRWSIVNIGSTEEVKIGENFFAVTIRKLYKYIDKIEFSLISYMVNSSFLAGRGSFNVSYVEKSSRGSMSQIEVLMSKRRGSSSKYCSELE